MSRIYKSKQKQLSFSISNIDRQIDLDLRYVLLLVDGYRSTIFIVELLLGAQLFLKIIIKSPNERKPPKLKFSYKCVEGKHQATLPEAVPDQPVEIVLVGVSIETSISIQLSAFDQRFL